MISSKPPAISVIMLTYNRKELVPRAIKSILGQTFLDFEFIIVDNGSTDGSAALCDDWAKKDKRIHVIHCAQGNIGAGRNAGLDTARGEYIAFIDDDDYAYPDMLEFLYNLAIAHDADIAFCGSERELDGKISANYVFSGLRVFSPEDAVVELFERKTMNAATPTKLWRKNLFNTIRFPETGKFDDIFVGYKLFATGNKTVAQGLPKYCFFRHRSNNSGFTLNDKLLSPAQLDEYFQSYLERTAWLSERFPRKAAYFRYSEWSFLISMCNKILKNDLQNCNAQLGYARQAVAKNYAEFAQSPFLKDFETGYLAAVFPDGPIPFLQAPTQGGYT